MRTAGVLLLLLTAPIVGQAQDPADLKTSPLARDFGTAPVMWGVRLSPDGTRLSAIQMHPDGFTIARVVSFVDGQSAVVLAGATNEFDITWCDWANDERLLCGLGGIARIGSQQIPVTRLVATNADGTRMKVLVDSRINEGFTQFQDRVIDWLPDDPDNVLVQVPSSNGSGVARLNVNTGSLANENRERNHVYQWISDGHGTPRLFEIVSEIDRRWYVRDTPDSEWSELHATRLADLTDAFTPIGFGENRNELLFYDNQEGRLALFALDLANGRQRRLVFAHPRLDVSDVHSLGKYERLVAVSYVDERAHLAFFDEGLAAMHQGLATVFPDKSVSVTDESWDQRYYLVFVASDANPGEYYRLDTMTNKLTKISAAYPLLADRELATMTPVRYRADDGIEIPAYLTLPGDRSGPLPAVILPHGGPSARDYWSYDFLVQYLAASGYAVLQSNYRGSDGYGAAWQGEGGFRDWRRAIGDITAGARYLVDEGIADPDKICAVGWSYGGYAALLSVIENPELYRCVASIAGVTDPKTLGNAMRSYVGARAMRTFIGDADEVLEQGSPLERVEEVNVPVLLVHAEKDVNVPLQQSSAFARALERADKNVEFIEYEFAEHDISPERYRIDLLARLSEFLDENL